jgi:hypothetical protein
LREKQPLKRGTGFTQSRKDAKQEAVYELRFLCVMFKSNRFTAEHKPKTQRQGRAKTSLPYSALISA